MSVSRCVRAAGALGHLLLFVVLAVSVFVMHTVGHPADSHAAGMGTASHAPLSHAPAVTMHGGTAAVLEPGAPAAPADAHRAVSKPRPSSSSHPPLTAMDMLSLCLAVLAGGCALAALLRPVSARQPDRLTRATVRIPRLRQPVPPPRGLGLTRLSVLRL